MSYQVLSLPMVAVIFISELVNVEKKEFKGKKKKKNKKEVKERKNTIMLLIWKIHCREEICTGKWTRYRICIIYWKPSGSINRNFIKLQSLKADLTCSLYQQMGVSDSLLFCVLRKNSALTSLRPRGAT